MNSKNQNNQPIQKVASGTTQKAATSTNRTPPKLTVSQIIDRFVKPSTHRKSIVLSEPETKKS